MHTVHTLAVLLQIVYLIPVEVLLLPPVKPTVLAQDPVPGAVMLIPVQDQYGLQGLIYTPGLSIPGLTSSCLLCFNTFILLK